MKQIRVVPSKSPVTSIEVSGQAMHFFHSQALGKCRAIIISPDENLPSPSKSLFASKFDVKTGLYAELEQMMQYLRTIPLHDVFEYSDALMRIKVIRESIIEIESNEL